MSLLDPSGVLPRYDLDIDPLEPISVSGVPCIRRESFRLPLGNVWINPYITNGYKEAMIVAIDYRGRRTILHRPWRRR